MSRLLNDDEIPLLFEWMEGEKNIKDYFIGEIRTNNNGTDMKIIDIHIRKGLVK